MQKQAVPNKIIIAPLNWGWGHATRCIPIIKEVEQLGLVPVIASDGDALQFLQKEFPKVEVLKLPSYNIKYGKYFLWSMFLNSPSILNGIYKEHQVLKKYVASHKTSIFGIVSDNRLGVYVNNVDSVYLTHQLNIRAGWFSFWVNKFHHYFIKKHKECWIPDEQGSLLSGDLSKSTKLKTRYIGILSRFKQQNIPIVYDVMILLSGIASQRNELELKIASEITKIKGRVLLVRGTFEPSKYKYSKQVKVVDYLLSNELETAINSSDVVITRSGYSSVMDMAVMKKKVLYIPTPGQTEQEYLATYLEEKKRASFCHQKEFSVEELVKTKNVDPVVLQPDQHLINSCIKRVFNLSQA